MKKILWFDTETTGLDPNRNGLIQLAMIMDVDGKAVDEVQINTQPCPDDIVGHHSFPEQGTDLILSEWQEFKKAGVLTIETPTGILFSNISQYLYPQAAIQSINTFLQKHISKFDKSDKAYIGGYNVPFDIAFLSKFYEKCGDKYLGSYINWKQIDVRQMLYMLDYRGTIKLDNYKLETVCNHFGIELEAHNPMSDIKATRQIFYDILGGGI
jgi:DNA polymerase III subunit epsilon